MNGYGGAERTLINLANELCNHNIEVYLVSVSNSKIEYKLNSNVKLLELNANSILERYVKLKKVLLNNKINVAINFWVQPTIFISKYANKKNIKLIYSERGDPTESEYNGVLGVLRALAFNKVDKFVFQTYKARECFDKSIQERSVIIHNPIYIETPRFDLKKAKNKIVTIGRLHKQKNQIQLLRVFKEILKFYPEYELDIYGDGPLKNELIEYCKMNEMEEKVKFKGTVHNVLDRIKDSRMFVLTSRYEGMPNALLEAMALGIPCISSNYSPKDSIYEFIEPYSSGLVYDLEDDNDLKQKILDIIEDDKLTKKLSQNGALIAEKNSKEIIYEQWIKVIENL